MEPLSCRMCKSILWKSEIFCRVCLFEIKQFQLGGRRLGDLVVFSLLQYVWPVESLIKRCKQGSDLKLLEFLSKLLARKLLNQLYIPIAGVIPVPAKEIGLSDHAQLIAESIAQELGVPLYQDFLMRLSPRQEQKKKTRLRRSEIKIAPLYFKKPYSNLLLNPSEYILIVDDLITSGTTMIQTWTSLGRPNAIGLTLASRPLFSDL
jgi:predicted amidophosphoribosyltransferase